MLKSPIEISFSIYEFYEISYQDDWKAFKPLDIDSGSSGSDDETRSDADRLCNRNIRGA